MNAPVQITASFSEELDRLGRHQDVYRAEPSDEWRQGRALFGGLVAALSVTAAARSFPDLPPLRSAQFGFVAPATGSLELAPRIVRRGKSTTFVETHVTSA